MILIAINRRLFVIKDINNKSIIIGDKDMAAGKVTLESRDKGQIGQLAIEDVLKRSSEEIRDRK